MDLQGARPRSRSSPPPGSQRGSRAGAALALAFVGWNPLLALHFAGGGHNDAWMAALVVGALAAAAAGPEEPRRRCVGARDPRQVGRDRLPAAARARGAGDGPLASRTLGFAAAAAVVVALASWRYGLAWLGAFGPLARNANEETRFAIPHRLEQLGVPHWLAIARARTRVRRRATRGSLREAWRGRARLGLAAALLLLTVPYLAPWYAAWTIPLAAAEEDEPARILGFALTVYLLPQTVPL